MIAWLNPGGLPLIALAALPIVIHLLLRRRARVVPFPTVRFIVPSDRSAASPVVKLNRGFILPPRSWRAPR